MLSEVQNARRTLMCVAVLAYFVAGGLVFFSGMQIDYRSAWPLVPVICATTVFGSLYCSWRGMITSRTILETSGIGFLITAPVLVFNYLAAYAELPLVDEKLSSIDQALGLDWNAFVHFVDARPWLAYSLDAAYQSFAIQLVVLPLLLSSLGRGVQAYRMVSTFALVGLIASLISVWFPAVSAFPYYQVEPGSLRSIDLHFG